MSKFYKDIRMNKQKRFIKVDLILSQRFVPAENIKLSKN